MPRRRFKIPDLSCSDYVWNAVVWSFWAIVFGLTLLTNHYGEKPAPWVRHLCCGGSLFFAVRFFCLAVAARPDKRGLP